MFTKKALGGDTSSIRLIDTLSRIPLKEKLRVERVDYEIEKNQKLLKTF